MKKTNFDFYLDEQLKDPAFAERFERAGEAWDVALQPAPLRQKAEANTKSGPTSTLRFGGSNLRVRLEDP